MARTLGGLVKIPVIAVGAAALLFVSGCDLELPFGLGGEQEEDLGGVRQKHAPPPEEAAPPVEADEPLAEEAESEQAVLPEVETSEVEVVLLESGQADSASAGGVVADDGGAAVTARGVVWSTSRSPTLEEHEGRTVDESGTGEFRSYVDRLSPGSTYYLRAYATNQAGTAYGEERSFTVDGEVAEQVEADPDAEKDAESDADDEAVAEAEGEDEVRDDGGDRPESEAASRPSRTSSDRSVRDSGSRSRGVGEGPDRGRSRSVGSGETRESPSRRTAPSRR